MWSFCAFLPPNDRWCGLGRKTASGKDNGAVLAKGVLKGDNCMCFINRTTREEGTTDKAEGESGDGGGWAHQKEL